jgi:hypothetical protein
MNDFTDLDEARRVYLPELEEFVKTALGADHVVAFGPIIRKASEVKRKEDQPVGDDVHVDFTTRWAAQLGRIYLGGDDWTKTYSRLLLVSNWRTFSDPPQDWPLGVCDWRSVPDEDGIINTLVYAQEIPDINNLPPLPESDGDEARVLGEGTIFPHRESQRWMYYSHMNRDELLIIKLNDSDKRKAWRTPHCAFFNLEEGAVPRESIEVRMCCYFK